MNAMLYVRGRPLDYDLWEAQGATGWGWDDVRPYFLKAENNERGASEHHAVGGPLNVADERSPRPLTARFLAAAEAAGIPRIDDYNGPEQDGASPAQVTQRNGGASRTNDAYLRPARGRDNLQVVTGAAVRRVEISGGRATGVRFRDRFRRERVARAGQEVILCGGAFGSPQLLMLSGVGPAAHLREHGIDVAHDVPGVGANLQDHPYVVCIWDSVAGGSLLGADKPKFLAEWLLRRSGPLTSTVAEAFAFVRSRPGLPAPDLQYHFAPAYFNDNGFDEYDQHAFTFGPVLVSPKSRGTVRLRSSDPHREGPHHHELARRARGHGVAGRRREARARDRRRPSRWPSAAGREIFPGPGVVDDADIEADIRRRLELLYHPVGTCRMGSDDEAVVDPELRVRGVEGLRVVDASMFPVIPGGNTNAPTIMVAERAADLIRGRVRVATAAR